MCPSCRKRILFNVFMAGFFLCYIQVPTSRRTDQTMSTIRSTLSVGRKLFAMNELDSVFLHILRKEFFVKFPLCISHSRPIPHVFHQSSIKEPICPHAHVKCGEVFPFTLSSSDACSPDSGVGLPLPFSSILLVPLFRLSHISAATFRKLRRLNCFLTPPCPLIFGLSSSTYITFSDLCRRCWLLDAGPSASYIGIAVSRWNLRDSAAE